MIRAHITAAVFILVLLALLIVPVVLHAQASDDLRATIRAQLLSDPRTAGLSEEKLDSMVNLLAEEAQKQGVTASDITWRPVSPESYATPAAVGPCGRMPAPLCALNRAFGFDGSDSKIPVGLGIASAILLLLIGLTFEMKYHPKPVPLPPMQP